METWPLDNKVISLKEKTIKPANRQKSSAGYTMSFPRGSVNKKAFIIQISHITYYEKTNVINGIERTRNN